MDFSSGNSGCVLRDAVVKIGPECQQEGAYCKELGSEVAPEIFAIIPNGYVMERLQQKTRLPSLLLDIESLLETYVWSRPSMDYHVTNRDYRDYHEQLGVPIPPWAVPQEFCMTHGDPTVSNTVYRGDKLIMCDPRPPRFYVPQCRESDMGRILQSYFQWETAAYNIPEVNYQLPFFWDHPVLRVKAAFWCEATTARIAYLEKSKPAPRERIFDWCKRVRKECQIIYG